jgi:hypothetical protein
MESFKPNRNITRLAILQRIELAEPVLKRVIILKKDDNTLHKPKKIACRFLLK